MDGYSGFGSFLKFNYLFVYFCKERFCCGVLSLFSMQNLQDFSNSVQKFCCGYVSNSRFDTDKPQYNSEK